MTCRYCISVNIFCDLQLQSLSKCLVVWMHGLSRFVWRFCFSQFPQIIIFPHQHQILGYGRIAMHSPLMDNHTLQRNLFRGRGIGCTHIYHIYIYICIHIHIDIVIHYVHISYLSLHAHYMLLTSPFWAGLRADGAAYGSGSWSQWSSTLGDAGETGWNWMGNGLGTKKPWFCHGFDMFSL